MLWIGLWRLSGTIIYDLALEKNLRRRRWELRNKKTPSRQSNRISYVESLSAMMKLSW
jgi:hypothetical protein